MRLAADAVAYLPPEGSHTGLTQMQLRLAHTTCTLRSLAKQLSPLGGRVVALRRAYHDESFGFRKPRQFAMPDCMSPFPSQLNLEVDLFLPDTPVQLSNRVINASLLRYADALRTHGHRAASIDPLGLLQQERVAALEPSRYGLSDPDATYDINGILWTAGEQAPEKRWALRDITNFLNTTYVGRIAYEYMDLPSKTERLWFSHLLESQSTISPRDCSPARQQRIHELLARSEVLDTFLQSKFPNLKRYGLEGGESMLPALDALIGEAAQGVCIFL